MNSFDINHLLSVSSHCISLFCQHIDHVGQDYAVVEAEYPEEQLPGQEPEVADPAKEQELEANLPNPDLQQGKPQFIDPI